MAQPEKTVREVLNAKAHWHALLWVLINLMFGLLPLLITSVIVLSSAKSEQVYKAAKKENFILLEGGILVFFFCALMGAIAVDNFLEKERKIETRKDWIITLVPVGLLFVLLVVDIIKFSNEDNEEIFGSIFFTISTLILSLVYCYLLKYLNFLKEIGHAS